MQRVSLRVAEKAGSQVCGGLTDAVSYPVGRQRRWGTNLNHASIGNDEAVT